MQSDAPVTTTLARYWPALCAVGVTALPTALVGLPLQSDGPLHHSLLTYLVVGGVVAVTIISGWSTKGMPSRALVLVSVTIGFLLNLIAFNTLVAQHDAGLEFIAPLVGLHTQTLRAILVLLFATFVSLLASFWHHIPGLGDTRSHGQGDTTSDERRHSTAPAAPQGTRQETHRATGKPPPGGAHAHKDIRRAAYQPATSGSTEFGPDGRKRDGLVSEGHANPHATLVGRTGRSRVLQCAIPVIVFAVACAWPAGGSVPCHHLGAEHAGFTSTVERAPSIATGKAPSAQEDIPLPLPSATTDRPSRNPGRNTRNDRQRAQGRAPP
jgi:hypothetical protein